MKLIKQLIKLIMKLIKYVIKLIKWLIKLIQLLINLIKQLIKFMKQLIKQIKLLIKLIKCIIKMLNKPIKLIKWLRQVFNNNKNIYISVSDGSIFHSEKHIKQHRLKTLRIICKAFKREELLNELLIFYNISYLFSLKVGEIPQNCHKSTTISQSTAFQAASEFNNLSDGPLNGARITIKN